MFTLKRGPCNVKNIYIIYIYNLYTHIFLLLSAPAQMLNEPPYTIDMTK